MYLTDLLSDGEPYDNSDSVVDNDEIEPKKTLDKSVYWGIIIVVVGVAVGIGLGLYFDIENHPNVLLVKDTIKSISNQGNEPTKDEVIEKLKACTIFYITIQSLIDQMEPEDGGYKLDSLPQNKQKAYNDNYLAYFDMYCNKIKDEIEQTEKFQNFNKTRGQ